MKRKGKVKRRKEEEEIAGWTMTQKKMEEKWAERENLEYVRGQESRGKEGRRWKGVRGEWAFVGVDVIALWGMSLQGAKGPQSGKGGGGVEQG